MNMTIRAWSIVDQTSYDKTLEVCATIDKIKYKHDSLWHNADKTTQCNAIRVLFQMQSLCQLFAAHDDGYSHIIVSRVDLLFTRPINAKLFESRVIVPNYASFLGLNDRFMAGPKHMILPLMNRLNTAIQTGMLAERLLLQVAKTAHISVSQVECGYSRRVRGTNSLMNPQYERIKGCPYDMGTTTVSLRGYPPEILWANCTKHISTEGKKTFALNANRIVDLDAVRPL